MNTGEDLNEGGLPGPVVADDRYDFSCRDVELDIARILSMQKLERAFAAQDVGNGDGG